MYFFRSLQTDSNLPLKSFNASRVALHWKIFFNRPHITHPLLKSSVVIVLKSFFSKWWFGRIHSGVLKALPHPPTHFVSARVSSSVWGPEAHSDTWRIYNTGLWAAYLRFLFKQIHLQVGTGSPSINKDNNNNNKRQWKKPRKKSFEGRLERGILWVVCLAWL